MAWHIDFGSPMLTYSNPDTKQKWTPRIIDKKKNIKIVGPTCHTPSPLSIFSLTTLISLASCCHLAGSQACLPLPPCLGPSSSPLVYQDTPACSSMMYPNMEGYNGQTGLSPPAANHTFRGEQNKRRQPLT